MYKGVKFKLKSENEIKKHIKEVSRYYYSGAKIFIADGNFLTIKTDTILEVLKTIRTFFPDSKRVSCYAGPKDLLRKTDKELKLIKESGLDMLYMGVESGSDKVLSLMNKGVNSQEMTEAGKKAKQAGFTLSCMIISGLGGKSLTKEHAVKSGQIISNIKPDFFALLTLMVDNSSDISSWIKSGKLKLLSPEEIMQETYEMIDNTDVDNCVFRANHASNYVNLSGVLGRDKKKLLDLIQQNSSFKPESWRLL